MRTSLTDVHCSIARTAEQLGDGWSMLILRDVFCGITRFEQLLEDLGISPKVLSARLDALVADDILARVPYCEHPPRHDYLPTPKGSELYPILLAMMAWGDRWTAGPDGPPAVIHHLGCGAAVTAAVTCSHCGEPLTADEAIPHAGPGGRAGRGTRLLGPRLASRRT